LAWFTFRCWTFCVNGTQYVDQDDLRKVGIIGARRVGVVVDAGGSVGPPRTEFSYDDLAEAVRVCGTSWVPIGAPFWRVRVSRAVSITHRTSATGDVEVVGSGYDIYVRGDRSGGWGDIQKRCDGTCASLGHTPGSIA
jgi:hypothetical protein